MLAFLSLITFASVSGKDQPKATTPNFKTEKPDVVSHYLDRERLKTGGYKRSDGNDYFACSRYKDIGKGSPRCNLAFYVEGDATKVKRVYLTLNVNDPNQKDKAHSELISASSALCKKATGQDLPKDVQKALEEANEGEWNEGDFSFKVKRVNFPTNDAYSLTFRIE